MGKLILRKTLLALVCSAVVVVLAIMLFPVLVTGLQLADGVVLTADNLFMAEGMQAFVLTLAVLVFAGVLVAVLLTPVRRRRFRSSGRSEEHTSELQSRENLVCRLLLEKKKFQY